MASSEILSETLFSITNIKLAQLSKQKTAYQDRKHALLQDVDGTENKRARTKQLLDGAKTLPSMTTLAANPAISQKNFGRFLEQAQYDPSISSQLIEEYESTLRNEIDVQSHKYEFASLYGELVNEWISADNSKTKDAEGGLLAVGRKEAQDQRQTWEDYVFKAKETDKKAITDYLTAVFDSDKNTKAAIKRMRDQLQDFQNGWDDCVVFTSRSLKTTIKSMLRNDVLTDAKRKTLKDFQGNDVVLDEIADVLNMRMATRSTWAWETDLIIDQRRNLNGRYRFYPDEDLLQSILLHRIGTEWGVQLRARFMDFLRNAWLQPQASMSAEQVRRQQAFRSSDSSFRMAQSFAAMKKQHYETEIFMDQLPTWKEEQRGGYGDDTMDAADTRKGHSAVVQDLLHLIQTEIIMQTRLGKDVTVIRSDFKWFGPSIPHSSIVAALEFFGVNQDWITLFIKVLEAPLRFKQDPEDTPAQKRLRGTPLSTPLADVFGEVLLFCVDFAVNRKANGTRLYRLHDDMWLWGSGKSCAKAWKVINEFTDIVGLEINKDKTGSASIAASASSDAVMLTDALPTGSVLWGFLVLDAASGRFIINQAEVNKHVEELVVQLKGCQSIFDWIQAWNLYAVRFFTNNCGKIANCYSRKHIDAMLETFRHIQQRVFPDCEGGAGQHLKRMIAHKFNVAEADIPDGYLYFPLSLGGLGLKNPFINLYLIRDEIKDPVEIMDNFFETEDRMYRTLKAHFEDAESATGLNMRRHLRDLDFDVGDTDDYMPWEEYSRFREQTSLYLANTYAQLMAAPEPVNIELKGDIKAVLTAGQWQKLGRYDQWVVQLFHKDMISRFGGLNVVEKGLLPMGLMNMLRESKFRWQG